MDIEIKKYRAHTFQIFGLACITPAAKITLKVLSDEHINLGIKFVIACIVSMALLYLGIMFILEGEECLDDDRSIYKK